MRDFHSSISERNQFLYNLYLESLSSLAIAIGLNRSIAFIPLVPSISFILVGVTLYQMLRISLKLAKYQIIQSK